MKKPFPNFTPYSFSSQLNEYAFALILGAKGLQRIIMENSDVGQPREFLFLNPSNEFIQKNQLDNPKKYVDILIDDQMLLEPRVKTNYIARRILEKDLDLPLVYKPQIEEVGRGILILSNHGDDLAITHRVPPIKQNQIHINTYLAKKGFKKIKSKDQNLCTRIIVNPDEKILTDILDNATIAWSYEYAQKNFTKSKKLGKLDKGILETWMNSLKIQDKFAIETRHLMEGNIYANRIDKYDLLYTRIGSNQFFSHAGGKRVNYGNSLIHGNKIYDILSNYYQMHPQELKEFAEEKAKGAFDHFMKKINAQGVIFDKLSSWQIDFMWGGNVKSPQVNMSEYHFWYNNVGWDNVIHYLNKKAPIKWDIKAYNLI